MINNDIYQYYVEGEDEKRLFETLKGDLGCIASGKVEKFNVIQNKFTIARVRPLKRDTIVVLVYDTDVEKTDILQQNVTFLQKQSGIKDVVCIPQVKNLEDELLYSCRIKNICELTNSKSKKNFKSDFIRCTNLGSRLTKCSFDFSKFWSRVPDNKFSVFGNDAKKIKI